MFSTALFDNYLFDALPIQSNLNKTYVLIAILCFCIGTLLFGAAIYDKSIDSIMLVGFFFVMGAITLNTLFLISLLITTFLHPKYLKENALTAFIILLNIPIACSYFYLLMETNF